MLVVSSTSWSFEGLKVNEAFWFEVIVTRFFTTVKSVEAGADGRNAVILTISP